MGSMVRTHANIPPKWVRRFYSATWDQCQGCPDLMPKNTSRPLDG